MLHNKNKFVQSSSSICLAFVLFFTISLSACSPAGPAATPTADTQQTSAAALQLTAAAIKAEANQTATAEKLSQQKQLTSAVQTAAAQVTNTPTALPTQTPIPTRTPDLAATQQVADMAARVERYVKDGSLPEGTGSFTALPDYDNSWAQVEYYTWAKTDYSPVNFVVEADLAWDSASSISNWDLSGCGFAFRVNDNTHEHYMIFLALDGNVRSYASYKGYLQPMGNGYYGKLDIPKGKAHVAVAMNGSNYTVYINDKLVKKYTGFANQLMTGNLAYTLVSGTNKDFGTRCIWSNAVMWEVTE
jgi:hypothetical protein